MFLSVFSQVAILFLLMGLGVVLTRTKVLNEACVKQSIDTIVPTFLSWAKEIIKLSL